VKVLKTSKTNHISFGWKIIGGNYYYFLKIADENEQFFIQDSPLFIGFILMVIIF
jgi:hypothetical protein